jgi:hypothetical protein
MILPHIPGKVVLKCFLHGYEWTGISYMLLHTETTFIQGQKYWRLSLQRAVFHKEGFYRGKNKTTIQQGDI